MGKLNLAVNQLLERKDVFADLMNSTLFDGEQILHQEEMERISDHSGVFQPGKKRRLNARERDGDIRMKVSVGTYSVIFANETQRAVHYAMPVRNMLYNVLEYTKQVQEIEKKHKDAGEKLDGDEFLSGIKKEDRIRPVITTVLYSGDDWDGCKSLQEMLDIDEETLKKIERYLPDYRINIINAADVGDPGKFRTSLKHIFAMLKYRKDKKKLYEYINRNREALKKMDYVETMAALVLLGEQKRVEELLAAGEKEETITVCKAIDDMIKDEERRGERRGEQRGRQIGEKRMLSLIKYLIQDEKIQLLSQIEEDLVLREELYLQYQI